MDKTGWQVTAAICGSLALLLGAAAWNTSRALDIANAQLSSRDQPTLLPAPTPTHAATERTETREEWRQRSLAEIEAAKNGFVLGYEWMHDAQCIGGALVRKTKDGWESVIPPDGQKVTCTNLGQR